ncbi:MAG TPA: tetratricopeptide repeat protein [Candidatus Binataceae bacterium]|nr:tetratricopeptide repeat protein [Candidatus Binataceae bacterium]
MNERSGRRIIGLAIVGLLLAAPPAFSAPAADVVNLAGSGALCLKDADQMKALERERAMFSATSHRSLAIIALLRSDAEPLIGASQMLRSCRSCGSEPSEIWVCIGDAIAVQRRVAPGKPLPQPVTTPAPMSAPPANVEAPSAPPIAQPPLNPSENPAPRESLAGLPDAQQARELAHTNRWQDLEGVAYRWRQSDPRSAVALFYSGLAAEYLGKERDASSFYSDAVRLDPSLGGAQFGYARALMRSGAYQEAIGPLQIVVRDFPSEARAWGDLGLAYMHSSDISDATRALQHAVDLNPSDYLNCGLAAQAYALSGRLDLAAPLLEKGIRKQPFDSVNVNWMRDLGAIYFYTGEYQRSAQLFDRTLQYDRGDPSTWYYLWQDYVKLDDAANAEQAHQTMSSLITPQHRLHTESLTSYIYRVHRWEHEAYIFDLAGLNLDAQLP